MAKGFVYNHRNTALRYVFLARVQGVHIPAESLARLVFLGSKQSRQTTINERCECESTSTRGYVVHFFVQKCPKNLKESPEKKKTAEFRKRVSAKTAVFSVFKAVK